MTRRGNVGIRLRHRIAESAIMPGSREPFSLPEPGAQASEIPNESRLESVSRSPLRTVSEPERTRRPVRQRRFADAREADCALVDLSHLGLIAVGGPEATDFLQGASQQRHPRTLRHPQPAQQPLQRQGPHAGQFPHAAHRAKPVPGAAPLADGAAAEAPAHVLLRAKATIDDASDALVCFGIIGDCADAALGELFGTLPEATTR
jgi:hypothetical protein